MKSINFKTVELIVLKDILEEEIDDLSQILEYSGWDEKDMRKFAVEHEILCDIYEKLQ